MGIGDVFEVEATTNCYYVDTGMYDTSRYGAAYVLDAGIPPGAWRPGDGLRESAA